MGRRIKGAGDQIAAARHDRISLCNHRAHGHIHARAHSHSYGHGVCYANAQADTYAETSHVTETSPDAAAASLSGSRKSIVQSAAGIDRSRLRVFG